eukprot:CAMPEP_0169144868 /NCGR_PEP_ID=MMETSP1015-20121227/46544_1 /TAXON_ID=342587 /ORGANISM="Karlodinium micrum, Strain CCMP2283" /LENGTH=99 /DNA_ID=CAMNT_0009212293 /DNA_START=162 /DNA_END=461 /DNA_ORIENTATION=-
MPSRSIRSGVAVANSALELEHFWAMELALATLQVFWTESRGTFHGDVQPAPGHALIPYEHFLADFSLPSCVPAATASRVLPASQSALLKPKVQTPSQVL